MSQCTAVNAYNKKQCKKTAMAGRKICFYHDPEMKAERSRIAKAGARARYGKKSHSRPHRATTLVNGVDKEALKAAMNLILIIRRQERRRLVEAIGQE